MQENLTCKQCGQSFTSSDKLEQHNQQVHMSGGPGMGGERGTGGMGEKGKTQGDVGKERR